MRSNLGKHLIQSNPAYKTTSMHNDNEFSIRFIIDRLVSEDDDHFTLTTTMLHALPSKPNNLELQLREINAVICHIRESKPFLKNNLQYILIGDEILNHSQVSVVVDH
jgi:hypothetical protein